MGVIFGTTEGNTSLVNDFVMKEFEFLKNTFIVNSTCAQNPSSASQVLMSRINGTVNKMKAVTMQSFIYYLSQNKTNYMELYAFHVTPLISTCSYSLSEEFEDTLSLDTVISRPCLVTLWRSCKTCTLAWGLDAPMWDL
jgi:hypothetical protein